jgi:hypothetical protein
VTFVSIVHSAVSVYADVESEALSTARSDLTVDGLRTPQGSVHRRDTLVHSVVLAHFTGVCMPLELNPFTDNQPFRCAIKANKLAILVDFLYFVYDAKR